LSWDLTTTTRVGDECGPKYRDSYECRAARRSQGALFGLLEAHRAAASIASGFHQGWVRPLGPFRREQRAGAFVVQYRRRRADGGRTNQPRLLSRLERL